MLNLAILNLKVGQPVLGVRLHQLIEDLKIRRHLCNSSAHKHIIKWNECSDITH